MRLITPGQKKDQESDDYLLNQFTLTGDPVILGKLYSPYMPLVYGVSLKYLNDREESKDAVMQIFEKLINEIPKHKIINFKSWLHVVTKNYCLMKIRSQKSQDKKTEDWVKDSSDFMEYSNSLHPIDEDEADMDKALEDCIEKLKMEQKECILQFYYKNRCYAEIADNMDLDEKKVKSYLQNAKRNLKICLEEKNES